MCYQNLNLCLHLNESQPIHTYKQYVYNKKVFFILLLIVGMSRKKSFAFRSLKCQKVCSQRDFNIDTDIDTQIYFGIKHINVMRKVNYH